jgi:hypothetical protein
MNPIKATVVEIREGFKGGMPWGYGTDAVERLQVKQFAVSLLNDFPGGFQSLEDSLSSLLVDEDLTDREKLTETVAMLKALLAASSELGDLSRNPGTPLVMGVEHDVMLRYIADHIASKVHSGGMISSIWQNIANRAGRAARDKANQPEHRNCVMCLASNHSASTCKNTLARAGFMYVGTEKAVQALSQPRQFTSGSGRGKLGEGMKGRGGHRGATAGGSEQDRA